MPKMKTRSSVKKRYRLTGKGRLKRKRAFRSHILTSKSRGRKRNLRRQGSVGGEQALNIKTMLCA
jgi:large subunit ribosomal protein L35